MNDNIEEFLLQAKILMDCSYLKKPFNRLSIGYKGGKLIMKGNMPDREPVCSFLMAIRPFIEVKERLYLNRILDYLFKYKKCDLEKLSKIKNDFNSSSKYPAITVDGILYDVRKIRYLYLYGKYFHLDKSKQKIYRAIEEVFDQLGEFIVLKQLEKDARLVLELRTLMARID